MDGAPRGLHDGATAMSSITFPDGAASDSRHVSGASA
jgi:hypothetical protein